MIWFLRGFLALLAALVVGFVALAVWSVIAGPLVQALLGVFIGTCGILVFGAMFIALADDRA